MEAFFKLVLELIEAIKKKPRSDWFSWRNNYEKKRTDRSNRATLSRDKLSQPENPAPEIPGEKLQ